MVALHEELCEWGNGNAARCLQESPVVILVGEAI